MALGSSIARGLVQGLGAGAQFAVGKQSQRKERKEAEESQWRTFTKQTDYLTAIQEEKTKQTREFQTGERVAGQEFQTEQTGKSQAFQARQADKGFKQRSVLQAQSYATQLKNFKQQSMFTQDLQGIKAQGKKQQNFESFAKMTPEQLAFQVAQQRASVYPADQRGNIINQTLQQLKGSDKASLLDNLGQTQANYSQWKDRPEFADAIPKQTALGTEVNMEEMFKYEQPADANSEVKKMTEGQQKRQVIYDSISTTMKLQLGGNIDPAVSRHIGSFFPNGLQSGESGANFENRSSMMVNTLLQRGEIVQIEDTWMLRTDAEAVVAQQRSELTAAQERHDAQVGANTVLANQAPQGTSAVSQQPIPQLDVGQGTSPSKQAFFEKEAEQKIAGQSKALAKDFNKTATLQTHKTLGELEGKVTALSPEAQGYLYGAGGVSETIRDLKAKKGDKGAQEALAFLSALESFAGKVRHEQFGSAQTDGEMKSWFKQLSDPSILKNPETLLAQLGAKRELMEKDVKAISGAYDDATKRKWTENNPSFAGQASVFDFADRNIQGLEKLDEAQQTKIRAFIDNGGDPAMAANFIKQMTGE